MDETLHLEPLVTQTGTPEKPEDRSSSVASPSRVTPDGQSSIAASTPLGPLGVNVEAQGITPSPTRTPELTPEEQVVNSIVGSTLKVVSTGWSGLGTAITGCFNRCCLPAGPGAPQGPVDPEALRPRPYHSADHPDRHRGYLRTYFTGGKY